MPGFVSGLIHATTAGLTGYEQGQDEQQRKMLAAAALKRTQAREDEELGMKRLEALAKARDAGLNVTPQASERSGDSPFNSVGVQIRGLAGPAEEAKPTRVGTIGGMDVTVPDGPVLPKSVRDKKAAIAAGVEKAPDQTLHERITELRGQGMKPEDAITQARQEFGQEDPTAQHQKNRLFDVQHPTRSGAGANGTPERRAAYVLRRAAQLTASKRSPLGLPVPGLPRAQAEQQAGEEYDRVHGIDTQVTTPSAKVSPQSKGDIVLPGSSAVTRSEAGGQPSTPPKASADTLSDADRKMATVDPAFRAWLKRKGKL